MMAERPPEGAPLSRQAAVSPARVLNFTVDKAITPADINTILEKVYRLAGCRGCGLVGFDVRLQVADPALRQEFEGIKGLVNVATIAGPQL
jgi:hypothetical protein